MFMTEFITPGFKFNLARLKCKFFRAAGKEQRKVCERFRELVSADLFGVLVAFDASAPGQHKVDSWVRALLLEYISSEINNMAPENVEESKLVLGRSCGALAAVMRDKSVEQLLAGIALDMQMLEVICMAGSPGGPRYSQMAAAEKHIKGHSRLSLASEAGAEIMSPLEQMNAMTISDEIGDKRFEVASQAMLDPVMLHAKFSGGIESSAPVYFLVNDDLVVNSPMLLEPMLVDTLAHVTEKHQVVERGQA